MTDVLSRRLRPGLRGVPGTGWQTLVADLSIILFMVTAGSLAHVASSPPYGAFKPAAVAAPAAERALLVWREEPSGPSLAEWLAAQPRDPRQQLTITMHYSAGEEGALARRIAALLAAADRAQVRTRIVAEPGADGVSAGLAFDAR